MQKCPTNSEELEVGFDLLLPTRWKGENDEVGEDEDIIIGDGFISAKQGPEIDLR